MLILSLILMILTNAVTSRHDKVLSLNRVTIIILLSLLVLGIMNLNLLSVTNGLGVYGGLFHITAITQSFVIFLALLGSIILLLTSFTPKRLRQRSFHRNILGKTWSKLDWYNLIGYQKKTMEYPLILFIIIGGILLISSLDIISILLTINSKSPVLFELFQKHYDFSLKLNKNHKHFICNLNKLKKNSNNFKLFLKKNFFYQKVVQVCMINSFLTKIYFIIFLILGCLCLGWAITEVFSQKPVWFLYVFAILWVTITSYLNFHLDLNLKQSGDSKGFIWVKNICLNFEKIKNKVRDNSGYKKFNEYWGWFMGLRILYSICHVLDPSRFNWENLIQILNELVSQFENIRSLISKVLLQNIRFSVRIRRFKFSKSIPYPNNFNANGRLIFASGHFLPTLAIQPETVSESGSCLPIVTVSHNSTFQYRIDNFDSNLERYCVLVKPEFKRSWLNPINDKSTYINQTIFKMNINKVKFQIFLKLRDEYHNLKNLTNNIPLNEDLVNTLSPNFKKYLDDLSTLDTLKAKKDFSTNYKTSKVSTVLENYDIIYPGNILNTSDQNNNNKWISDHIDKHKKIVKDFKCYVKDEDPDLIPLNFIEVLDDNINKVEIENPNNVSVKCLYKYVKFIDNNQIENETSLKSLRETSLDNVFYDIAKLDLLQKHGNTLTSLMTQKEILQSILKTTTIYYDIIKDIPRLNSETRTNLSHDLEQDLAQVNPKQDLLAYRTIKKLFDINIDGDKYTGEKRQKWDSLNYQCKIKYIFSLYIKRHKIKLSNSEIDQRINDYMNNEAKAEKAILYSNYDQSVNQNKARADFDETSVVKGKRKVDQIDNPEQQQWNKKSRVNQESSGKFKDISNQNTMKKEGIYNELNKIWNKQNLANHKQNNSYCNPLATDTIKPDQIMENNPYFTGWSSRLPNHSLDSQNQPSTSQTQLGLNLSQTNSLSPMQILTGQANVVSYPEQNNRGRSETRSQLGSRSSSSSVSDPDFELYTDDRLSRRENKQIWKNNNKK